MDSTALYVCGTRGSCPVSGSEYAEFGGATTCYVLRCGDSALIVDCGSGLANAEQLIEGCAHVDVLLTHYHYDHIQGLLTNPWLFELPLRFFTPDDRAFQLISSYARPPYWPVALPLESSAFFTVKPGETVALPAGEVTAMHSRHPDGGLVYRVKPCDKQAGTVCFLFDFEHSAEQDMADFVRDTDILIYDGMFSAEEYRTHKGWGHSTPEEGISLAKASGAGLLLITHHALYANDETLRSAENAAASSMGSDALVRYAREGERLSLRPPYCATRFLPSVFMLSDGIDKVMDIGSALSSEQDHDRLLDSILDAAMQHTSADGGTIYIAEKDRLLFHTLKTRSQGVDLTRVSKDKYPPVPMRDEYVCAYCALRNETVNIADVYENSLFNFSGPRAYDKLTGYHTQSMLVLPLSDSEGNTLGVLQLINAMDASGNITAFASDRIRLVELLSSFSSVALTNMRHTLELKRQMFSFINVIITAVDARTPYNATHTKHIVQLMNSLIRYVHDNPSAYPELGEMSAIRRETLLLCAWLHDIGKLVTPLEIMNKSTRLGSDAPLLLERLDQIALLAKLDFFEGRCDELSVKATADKVQQVKEAILQINCPGQPTPESVELVKEAAGLTYTFAGEQRPWLTQYEVECLMIKNGTLTQQERSIMEQHALMTTRLLEKMDFSEAYSDVKLWAGSHHEKLDGSGYPAGLRADQLPCEVRLLTILDIYEALVTHERPYKRAMPPEKAFSILYSMADSGQLDSGLVHLLEDSRAWESAEDIDMLSLFPLDM